MPPSLRLSVPDSQGKPRTVVAKLIDASEGGIGIETFVRLRRGAVIEITGDWKNPDLSLHIDGLARIAHVSQMAPGRYKIGLQFVEVAFARSA